MSEKKLLETKKLFLKLIKVRRELSYLKADASGQSGAGKFKYVSESSIIASIRPKLDELEIWFEQSLSQVVPLMKNEESDPYGFQVLLKYLFIDIDSGEQIERYQSFIVKDTTPQSFGSIMTYGMRYFLYRFFIIPMDEIDPDQMEVKLQKTRRGSDDTISKKQYVELEKLLENKKELTDQTMKFACGTDWEKKELGLSDIPSAKYLKIIDRIKSKVEGK